MESEIKKYVYVPDYFSIRKMHPAEVYVKDLPIDYKVIGWIYDGYKDKNGDLYLLPDKIKVYDKFYIPYQENKYNYKIGDYVYLLPTEEWLENYSFFIDMGRFKIGEKYKIIDIINNYFMYIENDKGEMSGYVKFHDVTPVNDNKL